MSERHESAPGILSPSQISTFADCERKWGWTYLEGLHAPPTGSAALGTSTHAQLEKYLTGGQLDFTAPNHVAEIAAQGLEFLPEPNAPGLEVEKAFKFQSPASGIWYRGFVDVGVGPEHRPGHAPLILDHKTTSDLKWAKTKEDLRFDVQAIIYAKSALLRWPEASEVDLRWVYYQTRGKKEAKPVEVTLSREHVENVFSKIEVGSRRIQLKLLQRPAVLDLPANPSACQAYGGCPFRDRCNLGPKEYLRAMTQSNQKTSTLSLLERLAKESPDLETAAAKSPFPETDQAINPPEYQPPPPSGPDAVKPPEPVAGANGPGEPEQAPEKKKRGKPAKKTEEKPEPEQGQVWTLYVNCRPENVPVTSVDSLIAEVQDEMRTEFGCIEYRLGEAVGFGKGAGMLSLGVVKLAKERAQDLYLDTGTPEGAAVKAALGAAAPVVVSAVR